MKCSKFQRLLVVMKLKKRKFFSSIYFNTMLPFWPTFNINRTIVRILIRLKVFHKCIKYLLAFIYGLGLFKGTTLCLVCYFSSFPLRITYSMQMWPSCSLVNLAYIIEHILILQYKLHKYANNIQGQIEGKK